MGLGLGVRVRVRRPLARLAQGSSPWLTPTPTLSPTLTLILTSLKAELPGLLGRFADITEPVNKLHVALGEGVASGAAED